MDPRQDRLPPLPIRRHAGLTRTGFRPRVLLVLGTLALLGWASVRGHAGMAGPAPARQRVEDLHETIGQLVQASADLISPAPEINLSAWTFGSFLPD